MDQLFAELDERFDLPLPFDGCRFAVNDDFVGEDYRLKEGDQLAILPPVAGG